MEYQKIINSLDDINNQSLKFWIEMNDDGRGR